MSRVRLSKSSIGEEEKQSVARVLDNEFLGMGDEVLFFETELADFLHIEKNHVVCVNTGTSALHLAICALDIGHGDEVIVPSITYVASLQAISAAGATPVICDVTEDCVMLDMDDVERRITERTKAIMPVHYASNCYHMESVYGIASKYGLRVIEDAAHSIGSRCDGSRVGSRGDVVCFSFDGIKNITSGEGGAVVTADPVVADRVRDARLLGVVKDTDKRFSGERSWFFDVSRQGYRYHMSNIMAAIGREQLKKIEVFGVKRRRLVERYREKLSGIYEIKQLEFPVTEIVPHIYVVRIIGGIRNELMNHLRVQGIECGVHYQPNHLLSLYRTDYSLPHAEKLFEELLSLPLHADLKEYDVDRVCSEIAEFIGKNNA